MGEAEREAFARFGAMLGQRLADLLAEIEATTAARPPGGPEDASGSVASSLLAVLGAADALVERLRRRVSGESPPPETGSASAVQGKSLADTLKLLVLQALKQPDVLARHYAQFAAEALRILRDESTVAPEPGDFRFKDRLWMESPLLRPALQLYLVWCRTLQAWLAEQGLDEADRRRIDFIFKQITAALAPSNLPLNPAALRRADRTEGESAVLGLRQWVDDLLHHRGMPRQIRPDAYQVGRDLALTPGAVVFRNEQLELIQYAPQTPAVRRRPVLLLPPQINKYYVFDLKPQNSILGHLVQSGLQMFTLSWRNPGPAQADWNLDTYVGAVLEALEAISTITGSRTVGLISACAGGLTGMALLGYLAETGARRVTNHSLLVTCLFPNRGSDLELFATPTAMALTRAYVRERRLMSGEELAHLFFWLRPTDLVWRYWINNYLMGRHPPPLDVLYWDNDSTQLPAAAHDDFIRMYENDVFHQPDALRVLGRDIDFRKLAVDSYVVGGEDDYLMPWVGCYHACQVFRGRHQFVLSTSGHVQSILRPPRIANTVYYTHPDLRLPPQAWRQRAVRHDGTWWGHWHAWLNAKSGALKAAPARLGSRDYPPLDPAPGRYVHQRIDEAL